MVRALARAADAATEAIDKGARIRLPAVALQVANRLSPGGILSSTWPAGRAAFWVLAMLLAFLVFELV